MKYIVILGAVLSVVLYYIIAEVIWQLRNRSFRRRLIIGVLIMALLASQIDFISIFTRTDADRVAAAGADTESGTYAAEIAGNRDAESRIITAFAKLPDDISKQVVPVGTALEELVLPDTLEAVCVKADTDTDTRTDADTPDSKVGGGNDDQGDGDDEEVASDEGIGQGDKTAENPKENEGDTESENPSEKKDDTESEIPAEEEHNTDTEISSKEEAATEGEPQEEAQSAADTSMQTEAGSFTMPEYQSRPVIEVKTLEMGSAANYASIEETIIIENITWQSEPEYDGDTEGEYVFIAILPEGYVLTDGVNTPQITVAVGGTDDTALLSGDGIMPIADTHATHNGITTAWTSTTSLPTSGSYYLENDVTLNSTWQPAANITICLNGHTIEYDGSNPTIAVQSGGTLNIYDCQGNGAVIGGSNTIRILNGGTAYIYGGTFENASENPTIAVDSGSTAIITDGKFINNYGGNVIQNYGTLEMSGGIVTGKSSTTRGVIGILNYNGGTAAIKNVTITTEGTYTGADDGLLADNGLRNNNGGTMIVENCNITSSNKAVYNTGGSTIKISGGTFQGQYGLCNDNGTFELSGSPTISGSTADIYLSNNQKITVTGTLGNAAPYSVLTQTNPTVGSPVEITDSSNTSYNNADKFTPANNSYILRKNSSSQLELAMLATYTITYNAGSYGSGSVSLGTKTEGVDYALSSDTFTRTGYTQTGWSKNSNGSTKDYALGAIYRDDASITLYPYWTANEYGITYKDQGNAAFSGTHESGYPTKHAYGTATPLKSASKTGYTFDGWYTDSSCTGSAVTSLGATGYTSDIMLYAKWTANEYGITYMDQGGAAFSGTHESGYPTKHTYGTATTLKSASKAGYTFGGWYTDSSCTGSAVTSLEATDYTSDITFYAKWTPKTNGGSSSGNGGSTGGNNGGSSSGSGNDSLSSGNNGGGTGTGNNASSGTQTGSDTSGNTQTDIDTTDDIQADAQTGMDTRNGRGNSTETNRMGAQSSSGTDNQSDSQSASADATTNSTVVTSSETGEDVGQSDASGTEGRPTGSTALTVKAGIKDGKITVEGDVIVTGTVKTAESTTMTMVVGEGSVIVTVVSDESQSVAGVADTVEVVNAVLTQEQIQLVSGGESIEIRVEVTDITDQVSEEDKDVIESGLADYKIADSAGEWGELLLGACIDISVYVRVGDGDWNTITQAREPIEVVIGIPDTLQRDDRIYHIARSHEGTFALLNDLDSEPDTITIKTEKFSTYAIVYRQGLGTDTDEMNSFLLSPFWTTVGLWSMGILVMFGIALFLILGLKRREEEEAY